MRTSLRLLTLTALFLGVTFVHLPSAQALTVPETLADRRPVGAGPVVPPFPIDHLGVLWDTTGTAPEHADETAEEHGTVRFRVDGAWTAWQPLTEDGAAAEGQWASALVPAGDAEAYQVRSIPAGAGSPRAVALNTTDGRPVEIGRRPAGDVAHGVANCLSRAEWGADESLRFDRTGKEVWPAEFSPVQTMSVHHTATANDDPTPGATVRAIYRYHAVDRGWGDIGYHYLVDAQGKVYEGRWSGAASTPCSTGGGGAEFAHDSAGSLVTGAHTGGYNSGNMGASLLGNFSTSADGAEPPTVAVDALKALLTEFATRHSLDPHATVNYLNPVNGYRKTVDMISGHRDWSATECPGERLYAQLPVIRDAVAAATAPADAPPAISISSPADGATVSGPVTVTAAPTDGEGIARVDFSVDGAAAFAGDTSGSDGWSASWDSTSVADGSHQLTATVTDTAAQEASATITVSVSNPVAAPEPGGGAPTVVEVAVSARADDAEERPNGAVWLNDSDLELGQDGSYRQTAGLRFTGVTIPAGAIITRAYVQFTVDERKKGTVSLTIAGEAADRAGSFTTASKNISLRPRTAATVTWSPAAWTQVGARTADQQTADLSSVVQEIVDRPGWAGDALVLLVTGTGTRTAEPYEGGAAKAPFLHVEYMR